MQTEVVYANSADSDEMVNILSCLIWNYTVCSLVFEFSKCHILDEIFKNFANTTFIVCFFRTSRSVMAQYFAYQCMDYEGLSTSEQFVNLFACMSDLILFQYKMGFIRVCFLLCFFSPVYFLPAINRSYALVLPDTFPRSAVQTFVEFSSLALFCDNGFTGETSRLVGVVGWCDGAG